MHWYALDKGSFQKMYPKQFKEINKYEQFFMKIDHSVRFQLNAENYPVLNNNFQLGRYN